MAYDYDILPGSDDSLDGAWTGYTVGQAFDEVNDTPGAWDDGLTSLKHAPVSNTQDVSRFFPKTFIPQFIACNWAKVMWRAKTSTGGDSHAKGHLRINGSNYDDAAYQNLTSGYVVYEGDTYPTNPDTGDAWIRADFLAGLSFGSKFQDPGAAFQSSNLDAVWLRINIVGAPIPQEQVRDVASRELWDWKRPKAMLELLVPLYEGMEPDIGDYVNVSHFAGPHPTDPGWMDEAGKMRRFILYDREPLPASGQCRLFLRDARPQLRRLQDDAWCVRTASGEGDSIARISAGSSRTFTRNSTALVQDPSSMLWVQVDNDVERHGYGGDLHEGASHNKLTYSGFQAGNFTDWTKAGTGGAGSAIEPDTEDLGFFDPETTGVNQSCKITTGNPPGVDLSIYNSSSSFGVGDYGRIQIAYKNDTDIPGALLYWYAQRSSDAKYFRDYDRTWRAALTWNPLPRSYGVVSLFASQRLQFAGIESVRVGIGTPAATAIPGQIDHVYMVQVETGAQATSPILSGATQGSREAETLFISNDNAARCHIAAQGTIIVEVIPSWSSIEIAAGVSKTMLAIDYDPDNQVWLRYKPDEQKVYFRHKIAGVNYEVGVLMPMYKGAIHRIVARWTGPAGEFGFPPYSLSLFAQGIGGSTVQAVEPIVPDECDLEIGGEQGGLSPFDGIVRLIDIRQIPLSNEEAVAASLLSDDNA